MDERSAIVTASKPEPACSSNDPGADAAVAESGGNLGNLRVIAYGVTWCKILEIRTVGLRGHFLAVACDPSLPPTVKVFVRHRLPVAAQSRQKMVGFTLRR